MRERWNESYTNIRIILLFYSNYSIIIATIHYHYTDSKEVKKIHLTKNEKSKDYCKADQSNVYCFVLTIFRLATPAFFRFTDVTEFVVGNWRMSNVRAVTALSHKHANSKVQNPPSQLRFWLPSIIITITINKP